MLTMCYHRDFEESHLCSSSPVISSSPSSQIWSSHPLLRPPVVIDLTKAIRQYSDNIYTVSFWHWPIIRTPAEGFPWVAIFFVLSGYVNALKPIKLMRTEQRDTALSGLATSAFRRSLRLVLPCTIVTVLTWIMAQFGAFQIGKAVNSHWLSSTSPAGSAAVWQAIKDLSWAIYSTWVGANNYYDMNQWSMMWFLKGSLALYLLLVAVSKCTPAGRMCIVFAVFALNWKLHDGMLK